MTDSTFSANSEIIKRIQLTSMAKRYAEFSRDYDCRAEAKAYDARIKKFAQSAHSVSWADDVLSYLQIPVPAEVLKYVTQSDEAKALQTAAKTFLSDKAKSDEDERARVAAKWDADITALLSRTITIEWCRSVEGAYALFSELDKRVKLLCKQATPLEAVYKDIAYIRKALNFDKSVIELCGAKTAGEDFWNAVDKLKKEYDGFEPATVKYCRESGKLKSAVAVVAEQRKAVADALDGEYQDVRPSAGGAVDADICSVFISEWEQSPVSARKLCKLATEKNITALKALCDAEVKRIKQERSDADAADKWDKDIIALCGFALPKGVSADRDNEDFRLKVDKMKADFDKAPAKIKALCKNAGELERTVKEVYNARKKLADLLDAEYNGLEWEYQRSKTHTMDDVNKRRAFIVKREKNPLTVRKLCEYATDKNIAALKTLCDVEAKRITQEQADALVADKWDKDIIGLCGFALSKGVSADRDNEDFRLKVDKLKADFDKAPAKIKALCKHAAELERTVREVYDARKRSAVALDSEFKRVRVSPSTRALVSDGRNYIINWNTVPKSVKALCLLVSDKEIANLSKFYNSEEKRLNEEDRLRAIRLAEEKERERKRKEIEERERKKRELDNDINDSYAKAKRGDVNAMFKLANYYFTGTGVTKSYTDAFEWYEKAAKKGHSGAMEKLGDCYYYGYGVEKSYSKAEKCYKKASKG